MSKTITRPAKPHKIRLLSLLAAVIIAWLASVRISSQNFNAIDLPNRLQDLVTLMSSVILESLPFIIIGLALSVLIQVWLPDSFLLRWLPRRPMPRRLCLSFLGMFMPVCECGNVPLSRGLLAKGLSVGDSLTFLLAAPILNPITIITTQQAFPNDPAILWGRLIAAFVIANFIGWLYSRHRQPDSLLTDSFVALCQQHGHERNLSRPARGFRLLSSEANAIMPALFVGAFIAALVQIAVPRDILYGIGSNPLWSIGVMIVLAFIVSICSNVDAFFALAFSNSFTAGSLVSFLVFGPMIDIKMLNLMKTTYKPIVLVQITAIVALISAIAGLVVQYAF